MSASLFCSGLRDLPCPDVFTVTHSHVSTALTALAQFRGRSCAWCCKVSERVFFFLNTSATTSGRIVLESCLSFCMHPGRGMGCCFHSQGEKPRILDPLKAFQHRWWAESSFKTENLPLKRKGFSSSYNHTVFGLGFGTVLRYPCLPVCIYRHTKQWQIKLLQAHFVQI